jgi:hypothetical protein
MAATTRRTPKKTTATKAKPAPTPEVEEDELEDLVEADGDGDIEEDLEADELEELEEDEVEESKPAGKKKSAGRDAGITFGIRDLCDHIKAVTGNETDPRAIRTLIRKMARDESGRVNREIKAGNRERYNWTGPTDPEVVAIVAAFKGGELEAEKQAKLAKLKADKAAKAAAKKAEEADEVETDEADAPAPKARAKKTTRRAAKPVEVEEVEDDEELDFDEE